ncbi:MAG: DUF4317 domain-containing protein [Ruminococcus sp.]|nr:DUF4317 domain-containing protein [Ruminococcus sp.]
MNKKELSELRKNFSEASDLFTLNHVVSAFVDAEKNIRCIKSNPFHNIPSEESECYMETLRRVLAGTLGKGLLEYEFPNEAYEETGAQNILYGALTCKLKDDSAVSLMLDQIVKNMDYVSTYAILIGHCTYTVFNKTKNDEINPYDSVEYSFLVTAICPVEVRVDGLIYNEDDNAIVRKTAYDRIVSEVPSDGFLYPTFTGRGPDVNHVLYSVRKPKEVNVSIVENVLGCKFVCTSVQEKESFRTLMQDVVADELSYTVITDVNEKLKSIAEEYRNDADLPAVDDIQMRDILLDSGVSEEKAEKVQNLYREMTREKPLSVCNLTENKTTLTAEGITIQIAKDATSKVRTQFIDGRRYLLIDLDEPQIQVNGMQVTLQEMPDIFMEESELEEAEEV